MVADPSARNFFAFGVLSNDGIADVTSRATSQF